MIEIIRCTLEDLDILCALSASTFYEAFSDQNSEEDMAAYLKTAYHPEKMRLELASPDSYFYFAYVDKALAGYLKLNIGSAQTEFQDEDGLEIERIYLRSSHQNLGIGQAFIQFAESEALRLNKQYLWLGVWEKNLAAQRFYKRNGFEPIGTHTFTIGSDVQTDFILKKQLEP
jgi:ribosomal protein S18 acetylase RimI-like enzyme